MGEPVSRSRVQCRVVVYWTTNVATTSCFGTMIDTNQHYITKAYLDRFVHPASGQNVLYPYRKGGDLCKPRGTKRLASATNFFRQREYGTLTDKLDEARFESEVVLFSSGKRTPSSLSQCIFDDGFTPTEKDKLHFAAAAAFLWCGSPVQIHNAAMWMLVQEQIALFEKLNTTEARVLFFQQHGEDAAVRLEESSPIHV